MPIRKGDGTALTLPGIQEVRTGDGRILYTASTGGDTSLTTQMETALHDDINAHRSSQGLTDFAYREDVATVARDHSQNMYEQQDLSHNLDGMSAGDRLSEAGISNTGWAENIARQGESSIGEDDVDRIAQEFLDMWLSSTSGHRENIESDNDAEGIGIYIDDEGGDVWATQLIIST